MNEMAVTRSMVSRINFVTGARRHAAVETTHTFLPVVTPVRNKWQRRHKSASALKSSTIVDPKVRECEVSALVANRVRSNQRQSPWAGTATSNLPATKALICAVPPDVRA